MKIINSWVKGKIHKEISQLYKLTRSVLFQNQTETLSIDSPLSSVVFSEKQAQNRVDRQGLLTASAKQTSPTPESFKQWR